MRANRKTKSAIGASLLRGVLVFACLLMVAVVTAQNIRQVDGAVVDTRGEAVIGAVIKVKGTHEGTITNANGEFSLRIPAGAKAFVVSSVGYKSRELTITSAKVQVVLEEDAQLLDDVVVVGYGTMKKRDLTGAVSSVKADDMELSGVPSIAHALAGRAAGMYVRQNSAQPGGGLDILIRGAGSINASNDPLYIVDGFPIAKLDQPSSGDKRMDAGTQGILNFLNPNDIESIEVLKDASSTAIYGSRAANGVVLITTKRGREGKTQVTYSGSVSYQQYTDMYDMLSLQEWMDQKNETTWETWLFNNKVAPWGSKTLQEAIRAPYQGLAYTKPYTDTQVADAGEGTDWLGLITRDGMVQEHNVSVQGGGQNTKFITSLNYYNNKGIVRNSGLSRYSFKSNLDHKINQWFAFGTNLTLSRIMNDNTQLGAEQYESSGIIRSAVQMGPHIKAYDEATGTYPINPLLGTQPNPYSLLNNMDKGTTNRLLGNAFLEATPIKGLKIRLNAGVDYSEQVRKTYQPKSTLYGGNFGGIATINNSTNNQYLLEGTVTYNAKFADQHDLTVMGGASYEQFDWYGSNLGNNNFLTDAFQYNNMAAGEGAKILGSGESMNKMASYFFRANYVLKNRYILTATFRSDGASVFARNHKWGYFPSVAVGWNMAEEPFMVGSTDWLSNLKWRFSFGQTGNSGIGANAFASYYAQMAYNKGDKTQQAGVFMGRLENPDLKWETTTEYNFGLDFGFLKGRIAGSVELYYKVISDLLNYKPLNFYHDVSTVMANIGKTQSKGLEISLNTRNIETKNFTWSTALTFATYKDTWLERTPDWKAAVYETYDAPLRPIYSRLSDGILQTGQTVPDAQNKPYGNGVLLPGGIIIKDVDGYVRDENGDPKVQDGRFLLTGGPDGIIDDADSRLIGTTDPGCIAGFGNTLSFKGFDVNIFFNGMFDRVMQDPTMMAYGIAGDGIATYGYNALRTIKDRWTPDNPSTTHPSSFYGYNHNFTSGDFFYQKAWFIRLQNVSVGYSLPRSVLGKAISKLRFSLGVNNVFVITPYTGLDPETDSYAASYPNARTYTLSAEISF